MENVTISQTANVRVFWNDRPENYSKEAKNKVKNHFAKKYGIDKEKIKVIYQPVKFGDNGNMIEITGAGIDNILDKTYQRSLMQEWIKREGVTVDFERILKLDDKVNGELNTDLNEGRHRKWSIKWLMLDNFLSFGENNYLPFSKLNGLTVVNSEPKNQGGKTTLTIDALKFLLYGSTTKTDKNEEVFNQFTDKNELTVRGMIDIESEEFVLERKMRRSAKKGGGWTITNKVNYYTILPDGEEKLKNEEDAIRTTKKLRDTIGGEKDFELLVFATESNLDDLIGLTSTESGKVLTRLIGLEVIELKEKIVREMYNKFDRDKKSNHNDVVSLTTEIEDHELKISLGDNAEKQLNDKLVNTKKEISDLNVENDRLLNSKEKIDVTITELNPAKLEEEITSIIDKGTKLKGRIVEIQAEIDLIGVIDFDEDKFHNLTKQLSTYQSALAVINSQITDADRTIQNLIDGGICKGCNRQLDNVDNTAHIETHNKIKSELVIKSSETTSIINDVTTQIEVMSITKASIDAKNRLELDRDRLEVEVGALRNSAVAKKNDLKKYNLNLEAIELNRKINMEVSNVKTKLAVAEYAKDDAIAKIEKIKGETIGHKLSIETKTKLIQTIKKEEEIQKIFKVYIDLIGKKGISKLVLRSVLPIINSEVQRLMDEVCDFDIEIFLDDKNDVQFLIVKDGVTKLLKSGSGFEKTASSLALRSVLGKLSILPMPNFITFDEVLGKVANDNLEKLKPLFDKIKDMYDIVFLITHNDLVKDFATNIITVIKPNNVSKIIIN